MRIAFGTDEKTEVTDRIKAVLAERGHEVVVWPAGDPWRTSAAVGELVAGGEVDRGVVCCWTGTGVSMAATRCRACGPLCTDPETAAGARRWNDANVLALGLRLTLAGAGRDDRRLPHHRARGRGGGQHRCWADPGAPGWSAWH